ncbi:thiamine phosphate synthase [Kocuria palustris]|uniref:thiamine phosphate synthase n=1 Tax=Kocuria palustris TaxID=71999 RepID=UPI0011A84BE3|nr:thiamine phosphate synthase [Kocuria palustris]
MSPAFDPSALHLYHVTDDVLSRPRAVPEVAELAVRGGATMIQVRAKQLTGRELLELLGAVADRIAGRVPVVVDDRVEIHLAARARGIASDGVHVGQSDLPPEDARRLCGAGAIIGLSAGTPDEVLAAHSLPEGTVDYLGIGAVRATATKPDAPQPLGVDGFAELHGLSRLPVVAIGGIRPEDAGPLRRAGADGVAVVSGICAAPDPEAAARAYAAQMPR